MHPEIEHEDEEKPHNVPAIKAFIGIMGGLAAGGGGWLVYYLEDIKAKEFFGIVAIIGALLVAYGMRPRKKKRR